MRSRTSNRCSRPWTEGWCSGNWSRSAPDPRLARVLQREIDAWSAKSYSGPAEELHSAAAYEACDESGPLPVEVQLLELTADYAHVLVSVNDGGWRAFAPPASSFIARRDGRGER